jgi:hypothetical protein
MKKKQAKTNKSEVIHAQDWCDMTIIVFPLALILTVSYFVSCCSAATVLHYYAVRKN